MWCHDPKNSSPWPGHHWAWGIEHSMPHILPQLWWSDDTSYMIMYHVWSYVGIMSDNLMICHIYPSSTLVPAFRDGSRDWGEMASHTHISPSAQKKSPNLNARSPKKCRGQNPRRGRTSFIKFNPPDPPSQEGPRRGGGWIAPPNATGNGRRQCVSLLWGVLLFVAASLRALLPGKDCTAQSKTYLSQLLFVFV